MRMKNLNVIKHEMVPEHFIMSEEEVQELKKALHVFAIQPQELQSVHLSLSCLEREKNETFLRSKSDLLWAQSIR